MKKVLNKISNDEIVALYFGNGDKFFCGKITAIDEEFFVLRSYTPYGSYDGYMVKKIGELKRIEQNSKYLNSLNTMVKCNHIADDSEIAVSDDFLRSMLLHSFSHGRIVTLELDGCEELTIGCVTGIEDDIISIKQYTEYGDCDGTSFLCSDDIVSLYIDGENERKIEVIKKDN